MIVAVAGCAAGASTDSTHSSATTAETTTLSTAVTSAGPGGVVPVASPQTVLAVWDAALNSSSTPSLVITAPLDGQIGSWEGPIGGNNKLALLGGQVRPGSDVAAQPRPAQRTITWANGQHRTIPTITATSAVAALVADGANSSCGGCGPITALTLHDPKLTQQRIATAAGPATIPVWSFAVDGSTVRVTAAAIPRSLVLHPVLPGQTDQLWDGDPSITAHQSSDGSVTISFIGGAAGIGPCGANYSARLLESTQAVVVVIDQQENQQTRPTLDTPSAASAVTGCDAVGHLRTVQVRTAKPLGGRPIIDGHTGRALPLT